MKPRHPPGAHITTLMAVLCCSPVAPADDDGWQDPPAPEAAQTNRQFTLTPRQVEQIVFLNVRTARQRRDLLNKKLEARLRELRQSVNLTPEQEERVRLAGQVDIERFFDRVDSLIERVGQVMQTKDVQVFQAIWQQAMPLQQRFKNGLFDDRSLLAKVVRGSLDDRQRESLGELKQRAAAYRYRALLGLYVAAIDDVSPLPDNRREALFELLVKETQPPNRFSDYDQAYVSYQVSTVPQEKLVGAIGVRRYRRLANAFRSGANYKQYLAKQGIRPLDPEDWP